MKQKLSASYITRLLYQEKQHLQFLNPKILKTEQIERMVQMMLDKYNTHYKERSASRDKPGKENNNHLNHKFKADIDGIS